jgi:hypothetical protein
VVTLTPLPYLQIRQLAQLVSHSQVRRQILQLVQMRTLSSPNGTGRVGLGTFASGAGYFDVRSPQGTVSASVSHRHHLLVWWSNRGLGGSSSSGLNRFVVKQNET